MGLGRDDLDSGAEGFILVGGRSSRFGSDKALYKIDERAMVLHVADALRAHVPTVTLVGRPGEYESLGLSAIPDLFASAGPLGGIVSALEHARAPRCLVAGCDMPRLASAPLALLLREAARTAADAIVPRTPDGRLQPLCAVYARRARGPLAQALREGTRKISDALERIDWRPLLVDDSIPFSNINFISDLNIFD